jgi:predicted DsbA family dithiol-disulfide isomerase
MLLVGETKVAGMRSKETFEQIIQDELNKQKPQILMEGMSCGIDGC